MPLGVQDYTESRGERVGEIETGLCSHSIQLMGVGSPVDSQSRGGNLQTPEPEDWESQTP